MSLSLRTINAPGVEITEVDRSQYSQTLTGSKVLVVGYADKGEDFATMNPTSRSTIINVYGKPTNEAERYFYEACKEVISQGGTLYSAKIPYDNSMAGKYAMVDYVIGTPVPSTGSVDVELSSDTMSINDLETLLTGYDWSAISADESALAELSIKIASYGTAYGPGNTTDTTAISNYVINYKACLDNELSVIKQMNYVLSVLSANEDSEIVGYTLDEVGNLILSDHTDLSVTFTVPEMKEVPETYVSVYMGKETIDEAVYTDINAIDPSIKTISEIKSTGDSARCLSGDQYDELITGESTVPVNTIRIVDITRGTYGKTPFKGDNDEYYKECVGIVPVITTAANALFTQMLLSSNANADTFNAVSTITTLDMSEDPQLSTDYPGLSGGHFTIVEDDMAIPFGGEGTPNEDFQKAFRDSLNARAVGLFPSIATEYSNDIAKFDREYFKQIGIVVFKAFIDTANNNKINFDAVEAFVGSLNPNGKNVATGANIFIDSIVNSQSEYIRVFSNAKTDEKVDLYYVHNQPAASLGFYEAMTVKNVSYESIANALNKIFDRNSDLNEKEIDIVVDGGITTIAGYIGNNPARTYDPTGPEMRQYNVQKCKSYWRSMAQKFDDFCKNMRKDCIFVCDGMRQFCLDGKKRIVRPSKPSNTIDTAIVPKLLDMQILNSNYTAGYCDWFEVVDEFSGDTFWCPPSIKAAGVYIYTDLHANYWDAPAGLNRGMVSANDVAFNPNVIQAGPIYLKNWNYAINYPDEGVILEGQKTGQIKPSAFDRVNVRRLFLRLERYVYKVARYFVYEPNVQYTRDRFVDALNPYFSQVKTAGGIYDYVIKCDEEINTPETIDRNELRVRIGIKPTKSIEFVLIQFVCLRTGGSWEELTNI